MVVAEDTSRPRDAESAASDGASLPQDQASFATDGDPSRIDEPRAPSAESAADAAGPQDLTTPDGPPGGDGFSPEPESPGLGWPQAEASDPLQVAQQPGPSGLTAMLDVPLEVSVEVGRVSLPLGDVLGLQPGSVVELERVPGEPLDLLVNGRPVAKGEIVLINDTFGFRVTEVFGQPSRSPATEEEPQHATH